MERKLQIVPRDQEMRLSAKKTLRSAYKRNFDEVIVVGFKAGEVSFNNSQNRSVVETIGLLELIKLDAFKRWA